VTGGVAWREVSRSVLITKFYLAEQMKRDEGGGACGRFERVERL